MNNDLFINKKRWHHFTTDEMINYKSKVFEYFRNNGFPYFPTNRTWRLNEFRKLLNYDYRKCIDIKNKTIKQTMHGLSLCWSYHPHHYNVKCNNKRTVMEVFNDDESLRGVIEKRIKMGDNMSDNGLRKMLKIYTGTQCVSNFRPTASAAIYSLFCDYGDTVYDMSMGFGGRCLGAKLANVKYIGTDPSTKSFKGVYGMASDFNCDVNLFCQGSESSLNVDDNSVDFCFTSPPYFNCEKYSNEDTQSYIKYPTKYKWLNGFMRDTLTQCKRILKNNKYLALNVQNVPHYKNLVDDIKKIAHDIGFVLDDAWNLQMSSLSGGHKTEPILIYRNKK